MHKFNGHIQSSEALKLRVALEVAMLLKEPLGSLILYAISDENAIGFEKKVLLYVPQLILNIQHKRRNGQSHERHYADNSLRADFLSLVFRRKLRVQDA